VVFSIAAWKKEHQIFGIRAIIEAIQAGATVDKVYIQKEASSDMKT
jgi:23S rRNA (guanosine2251-2'-O)-methyltransferase